MIFQRLLEQGRNTKSLLPMHAGYKAFISYSHSADSALAQALQTALERFAKPWYQKRTFRVFRDTANLSIAPELWPEIEKALAESDYLLLMAARGAAKSKWVTKEVTYWREKKDLSKLLFSSVFARVRAENPIFSKTCRRCMA
jgi:hypothetical protein